MTFLLCWVFQYVHTECLSIYLELLLFFSSVFCSFQHLSLIHVLLELHVFDFLSDCKACILNFSLIVFVFNYTDMQLIFIWWSCIQRLWWIKLISYNFLTRYFISLGLSKQTILYLLFTFLDLLYWLELPLLHKGGQSEHLVSGVRGKLLFFTIKIWC